MNVSNLVPGRQLRDKLLFNVSNHSVLHDKFQIVIQHPVLCSGKGSRLDRRKTFHRWPQALDKLSVCGIVLTSEQRQELIERGKSVDVAKR